MNASKKNMGEVGFSSSGQVVLRTKGKLKISHWIEVAVSSPVVSWILSAFKHYSIVLIRSAS